MENQNSVCFIAKISEIREIPDAQNIEQALIGGWECIVKKDSLKVGELVVCATTDAVIPVELSNEMGVTNYLRKGNRVRTVKLKGVYSECLIIPLERLPNTKKYEVGDDVMDILGIHKYEPPVRTLELGGGRKIKWTDNPNFSIYYKFPNLKNKPGMFTTDDIVEITRKIHGTSARYGIIKKNKLSILDRIKKLFGNKWAEYEFIVGSHNVEKGSDSQGFYDTNVWYDIEKKYDIKNKLWNYVKDKTIRPEIGNGITIYGEIYGAGIQKGYDYGLKDIRFAGFDIIEKDRYLNPINSKLLIKNILDLPYVDVLHFGSWSQEIQDEFVFDNFIYGTKTPEEGIVIKHVTGERSKVAKVINPSYLIYGEKNNIGDSH
jgi:RNA ligase (TIGR02306 family)